jgi:hypothetical protein
MKKTFLAILAAGMLISCGPSRQQSPILIERGIPEDERNYDVVQEGYGIDPAVKKVFLAGYVAEGMNKNLVNLLWGPPDRESENGLVWEYINYKTGEVITRLRWEEVDPTKFKGVDWTNASKLIAIEGDPDGGSPPRPDFEDESAF